MGILMWLCTPLLVDLFLLEIPHYIWKPTSLIDLFIIFVHSYLHGWEIIVIYWFMSLYSFTKVGRVKAFKFQLWLFSFTQYFHKLKINKFGHKLNSCLTIYPRKWGATEEVSIIKERGAITTEASIGSNRYNLGRKQNKFQVDIPFATSSRY